MHLSLRDKEGKRTGNTAQLVTNWEGPRMTRDLGIASQYRERERTRDSRANFERKEICNKEKKEERGEKIQREGEMKED